MATLNRLTARQIKAIKPEPKKRKYADGGGLYFVVRPDGRRGWFFIRMLRPGYRPEIGLGPYPEVSLASAREKRDIANAAADRGEDPRDALNPERNQLGRGLFVDSYNRMLDRKRAAWKSGKTAFKYERTRDHYAKNLMKRPASDITVEDVARELLPIWETKHPTAVKVREHLEAGFDQAMHDGVRERGLNPAKWRGVLELSLPAVKHKERNHPALPWQMAPQAAQVMLDAAREQYDGGSIRAGLFALLTGCRISEALQTRWSEIDYDRDEWTILPENEKIDQGRVIPLTKQMKLVLGPKGAPDALVFPGQRRGNPWTTDAVLRVVRRTLKRADILVEVTTHGFRTTFRTWTQDETSDEMALAEMTLGHAVGTAVTRAYARSTILEKRRDQMQRFNDYLLPEMDPLFGLDGVTLQKTA